MFLPFKVSYEDCLEISFFLWKVISNLDSLLFMMELLQGLEISAIFRHDNSLFQDEIWWSWGQRCGSSDHFPPGGQIEQLQLHQGQQGQQGDKPAEKVFNIK